MYGYISCSRDSLNAEEQERYQEIYCGLCRKLGREYGQLGRLSLSYDMTFLILFSCLPCMSRRRSGSRSAAAFIPAGKRWRRRINLQGTRRI